MTIHVLNYIALHVWQALQLEIDFLDQKSSSHLPYCRIILWSCSFEIAHFTVLHFNIYASNQLATT